jgi:protein-disulfide isomerase
LPPPDASGGGTKPRRIFQSQSEKRNGQQVPMIKTTQNLMLIGVLMTLGVLYPRIVSANASAVSDQNDVASSQVAATMGGSKITLGQVEQAQPDEILGAKSKILSSKYALFMAERTATLKFIGDQLLAKEAAREHLTTEELIKKHVDDQIKDPSEEALKIYYLGAQTDMPYADARPRIIERVHKLEQKKALDDYMASLRKAADVRIALLPPRLEVAAGTSPSVGPADARVTVVEFADYQCPYCHQMEPALVSIREQYGDRVRFVYKDFPLPMHQYAEKAAEAALCAGQQGQYWAYHDALFATTTVDELEVDGLKMTAADLKLDKAKFASCLDSGAQAAVITQNIDEGKALGLSGTPTILVNGYYLSGVAAKDVVTDVIDIELARSSKEAANDKATPTRALAGAIPVAPQSLPGLTNLQERNRS